MKYHDVLWKLSRAFAEKSSVYRAMVSAVFPQYVSYESISRSHQMPRGMQSVSASFLSFSLFQLCFHQLRHNLR